MKRILGAITALAVSVSLTSLAATSASADPLSADDAVARTLSLSPEESVALAQELDLTVRSSTLTLGYEERTTYTLDSGSTIVVEKPASKPGEIAPAWSVGVGWGWYVYLNQSDQRVLAAGGAAGLAVAICGATALIGCAAITAAMTTLAAWIADRGGICTGSKPYLEYRASPTGQLSYRCVVAPG